MPESVRRLSGIFFFNVKQIGEGEKLFFSIIPFWGSNKNGEQVLHSGNPEQD